MPPKPQDPNAGAAISAGFNGAVGTQGAGSALDRLRALLTGGAPAPTAQGQAQQAVSPNGDADAEKLAKLKALQSIGGAPQQ